MELLSVFLLYPQILILAILGGVAGYTSCSVGIRAGWLAYHPSICGAFGALFGTAVGLAAAMV